MWCARLLKAVRRTHTQQRWWGVPESHGRFVGVDSVPRAVSVLETSGRERMIRFRFMHLADAFIRGDVHCIYQFMHSLEIKPMTLALLFRRVLPTVWEPLIYISMVSNFLVVLNSYFGIWHSQKLINKQIIICQWIFFICSIMCQWSIILYDCCVILKWLEPIWD